MLYIHIYNLITYLQLVYISWEREKPGLLAECLCDKPLHAACAISDSRIVMVENSIIF